MRAAVGVGVLASLLPCWSGCSFALIREPPVLTPTTTDVSCTTTRVPVVLDRIVAGSAVVGIGAATFLYDDGQLSGSGLALSVALGLAVTGAFLASANVGINRTEACRETIAKLHLRDLRQARERDEQLRRSPSPAADAGADTQLAPDSR
jgi:hypothetical protein